MIPVSAEQREIDDIDPAEDAVDDRPQDRMVVRIGDRDRQRRAEADAIFGAFDANGVIAASVHPHLLGAMSRVYDDCIIIGAPSPLARWRRRRASVRLAA